MKKRRCLTAIMGLICLLVLPLSGCKKVTAVDLVKEAAENVKEVESYRGTLDMDMGMGVADSGVSTEVGVTMAMDMEAVSDPNIFHMSGEFGMDLLNLTMSMDVYGETQGDEAIVYTNIADQWQKQVTEVKGQEESGNILNLDTFTGKKELKLADKTEKENGKEVYVITTTIDGEDFNKAMESISGVMDEEMMGEIDFTGLTMDAELRIYKDSKLPASIIMTTQEDSKMTVEEAGTEVSINHLSYEIKIQEYNTIDSIEIPKEALEVEEIDESQGLLDGSSDLSDEFTNEVDQDENGNYILKNYDESVKTPIAAPEGYAISDFSDSTYLTFEPVAENNDVYASLSFSLTELGLYYTEDDLKNDFASDQEYYTEEDDYHDVKYEDVKTLKAGNYDVKYVSLSYRYSDFNWNKEYYAWTVLDSGYALECRIYESSYEEGLSIVDESTIRKAFEAIR